jgi:hypothetical protein
MKLSNVGRLMIRISFARQAATQIKEVRSIPACIERLEYRSPTNTHIFQLYNHEQAPLSTDLNIIYRSSCNGSKFHAIP